MASGKLEWKSVPVYSVISDVLCEFLQKFVYSLSEEVHIQHVKQVLNMLQENQLYVKGEKCKVHVETITFLGYIISSKGTAMDDDKLRPRPRKTFYS